MRTLDITYVASFEITQTVKVSEEDYAKILAGNLPDNLDEELYDHAILEGYWGHKWSAKDRDGEELASGNYI